MAAKRIERQSGQTHKNARQGPTPTRTRTITSAATSPVPIDGEPFRWTVASMDHEFTGAWDWSLAPKEARDLLDLLEQLGVLTWREVKRMVTNSRRTTRALHHDQPTSSICRDAQQRLVDLQIDVESVFRLRHGNLVRVWGYLQGPVFHILWYDRAHQVCPTEPQ